MNVFFAVDLLQATKTEAVSLFFLVVYSLAPCCTHHPSTFALLFLSKKKKKKKKRLFMDFFCFSSSLAAAAAAAARSMRTLSFQLERVRQADPDKQERTQGTEARGGGWWEE